MTRPPDSPSTARPWGPVPLARRMLLHHKPRFVLSLVGVGFAVVVMFMQIGFLTSLTESQRAVMPHVRGELVMIAQDRETLARVARTFPRTRLVQARQWAEVESVAEFYEGFVSVENPQTQRMRYVHTLAFPLGEAAVSIPGLARHEEILRQRSAFLWDERSRPFFGEMIPGARVKIAGVPLEVAGSYRLGPSISRDGYAIMSPATWFRLGGRPERVSMGVIRLHRGADATAVRDAMLAGLPEDVTVMVRSELIAREDRYSVKETPAGVIFGGGLVLGFVIGVVICYQILFNEVLDHLPQYATLKAIGFSHGYLTRIVLKESFYLALLGYLPGLLAAFGLYLFLGQSSGMTMRVTWDRALLVLVLTLPMCVGAGLFALRRALQADPAEVF